MTGRDFRETMGERSNLWIGSIVMECKDFSRMMAFWEAALGYEHREPPSEDWVVLTDPRKSGPNISLQKVREGPTEDYRFHFDLYSSDLPGEVERLLALGAVLTADRRSRTAEGTGRAPVHRVGERTPYGSDR